MAILCFHPSLCGYLFLCCRETTLLPAQGRKGCKSITEGQTWWWQRLEAAQVTVTLRRQTEQEPADAGMGCRHARPASMCHLLQQAPSSKGAVTFALKFQTHEPVGETRIHTTTVHSMLEFPFRPSLWWEMIYFSFICISLNISEDIFLVATDDLHAICICLPLQGMANVLFQTSLQWVRRTIAPSPGLFKTCRFARENLRGPGESWPCPQAAPSSPPQVRACQLVRWSWPISKPLGRQDVRLVCSRGGFPQRDSLLPV